MSSASQVRGATTRTPSHSASSCFEIAILPPHALETERQQVEAVRAQVQMVRGRASLPKA